MQGELKGKNETQLLKWTETIIEAFFLQLSVFGGQSTSEMEGELDYAQDLIERIQRKIDEQQAQIELVETLGGQIDTIVEQQSVLAAKISAKQRTTIINEDDESETAAVIVRGTLSF